MRPRSFYNAWGALLSFSLGVTILAPALGLAQSVPERADEYRVKAAILYNLAKFVDWPADAFPDASASFTICVLGVDPFGPLLDEALKGHQVARRAVVVKRITEITAGCHALFIASSERKRLPVILDRLGAMSVLTVSEDETFTDRGGMIGLTTEGEQVKFIINGEAAERARLKVSARLMTLASAVRRSAGTTK